MKTLGTFATASAMAIAAVAALTPWTTYGQQANPVPSVRPSPEEKDNDDVIVFSPFEVSANKDTGYATATTLAGNRLNTDIKDLGTSLSIYNSQFLRDIGATDNQSLLKYTLGTEIGGVNGNYSGSGGGTSPDKDSSYLNPQGTNRVRGLVAADNTRDLYLSSIPWDGYNVDAVDLQRGPNAILFGQGSAGGVINTRTKQATYWDGNEVGVRVDEYGSVRGTLDINKVLLKDELALRFAAVDNFGRFKQKPAFEDFNREWLAVRYEPGFLKKGGARTIFKVDGEIGNSNSNRPRNMPPGDRITPWFTALNKELYNVAWMNDQNWELPGRGTAVQSRTVGGVTSYNPNYNPWVFTNYGNNYFGGSEFFFLPGSTTPDLGLAINAVQYPGLSASGARDGTIGGLPYMQPRGVNGYRAWAAATNQPFATLAKDKSISDPNIFDFYHKLVDGDIKRESSKFRTYDVSLSQTFFTDSVGFDVGYHEEKYTSGNYSPLIGDGGSIFVDFNSVWPDGTNTPATGWYHDGTANPGAGRPFVQLGSGRSESIQDRESLRATGFVSHDFDKGSKRNWLLRILGKQTVTGMASRDDYSRYSHNWSDYAFAGSYYMKPQFDQIRNGNGRLWADFVPIRTVYVGDSMVNKSLGQNLGINSPGSDPVLGDKVTLRYFDPTWIAAGVDPAAPWYNQVTAGTADGPVLSTQSENPANYRGWLTEQVPLLKATDGFSRDLLTTTRTWDTRVNKAYAFVWQGRFWDNSLVGTAGVRHDEVSQHLVDWAFRNSSNLGSGDPSLVIPNVTDLGPIKNTSKSWGGVAHLNDLPGLSRLFKSVPVNISLSYNKSDNFQTGQIYADFFGQQLPLPKGDTKDMGVTLSTKDNRFSMKLNKFKSTVANNPSSFIQFWTYGNLIGVISRSYHQFKYNNVIDTDPNSTRYGNNVISDLPVPTQANPNPKWTVDFQPINGQTLEQAQQQEIASVTAWDQWISDLAPLPLNFAEAWHFNFTDDLIEGDLNNFRLTSELVSKGYEFELNAQITDAWRLSLNASRIESIIDNIGQTPVPPGGPANIKTQMDFLLDFGRRLRETAMGDMRFWGTTARTAWGNAADSDLNARLAEQGTVVPETRLWRVNVLTNYEFKQGKLRGWNIGGAARYQSASTLAYKPIQNAGYVSYDLNAPYRDKAETNFDLWVGYRRKLFRDRIDWQVQLNVTNVGVGNELLPVTVQPDGTPATYRIRPPQQIFMTNTFGF